MKPHPRIRKTIKWGGAVVTVLLVVVWIGSGWWNLLEWRLPWFDVAIDRGQLHVCSVNFMSYPPDWPPGPWPRGSFVRGFELRCGVNWWSPDARTWGIVLPACVLAIITGLPTVIAWRLDMLARRRERSNLCPKCNYDRAGIAGSAKCPECGASPMSR